VKNPDLTVALSSAGGGAEQLPIGVDHVPKLHVAIGAPLGPAAARHRAVHDFPLSVLLPHAKEP
jgi:hypothetical protein